MRPRLDRLALILSALLLLPVCSAPPASEAPPAVPAEVVPISTFRIEVDGAEIRRAQCYVAENGLLILGCNLKDPILVGKGDRTVRYFPSENVIRDDEGNVTLKGSPTKPFAVYQVNDGVIVFQAEGKKVRVSPKAPLVGPQTLEAIIEHNPDYETRIKGYKPDGVAVAYLSNYARKTDLEIYFGTWCSVCEAWVPRLVKSLQTAGNFSIQSRFIALPRSFFSDPVARRKGITGIPTIIVLQDGREVGRIEGRPEQGTIEEALVRVLHTLGG